MLMMFELSTAGLLAVGLQAQLRDAEAHAGEAEADRKAVRTAGLQLVRDTVSMFQLTATEVFGSATLAFAQQQVRVCASSDYSQCTQVVFHLIARGICLATCASVPAEYRLAHG